MRADALDVQDTLPRPRRSSDELGELFTRHRGSLAAQARAYLRNPSDVDDVVQEAFVRLMQSLPDLCDDDQVVAYGRRTVRNLCIDRYRGDARRPLQVELDAALELPLPVDEDPVVRDEEAALVREALDRLSPLHRAALLKREVEEKPLPVIAAELGIAEDSAKHLLHRARRALRRLLDGTQLAPGADPEVSFARLASRGGSRAAALLVALAALLGSGPDLRVVPVVGDDLPDLPSIVELVRPVLPGAARADRPAPAPAAPAVPEQEQAPQGALPVAPAGLPVVLPPPAPPAVPSVAASAATPAATGDAVPGPAAASPVAAAPTASAAAPETPAASAAPAPAPEPERTQEAPEVVAAQPQAGSSGQPGGDAVRAEETPEPTRDEGPVETAEPEPTWVES